MSMVATADHIDAARRVRDVLATYEAQRDFILIGAYKKGSDPRTDYAISRIDSINSFLRQRVNENTPLAATRSRLQSLA
jgi:flagellar biosynthesis/type III secretory pathway ATPase